MIQRLHPRPRSRAGITLTEILISIMIMGIGLVSLATLFPLGLLRIRDANRASRSALLIESATSEIQGRNLLDKRFFFRPSDTPSLTRSWYAPPFRSVGYDPFIYDPSNPSAANQPGGISRTFGKGVPIAYDPLWWSETYLSSPDPEDPITPANREARFASGIGWIRDDPSAHGLQRITNFDHRFESVRDEIVQTFASTDDIVFQSDGTPSTADGIGNPLVPDMSTGGMMADLSYTWIFTGQQNDAANPTQFDGHIVVFHNRPFGLEQVTAPNGSTVTRVRGETVVEAIFGYGPPNPNANNYALSNTTVLLRWPQSMPDPDVRIGGYIADVTYERYLENDNPNLPVPNNNRFTNPNLANPLTKEIYPAQRCYWYRIVKRNDPVNDGNGNREMVVHINTPVRAKTRMSAPKTPAQINAAFVSPYVVNVVPRSFSIH